MVNFPFTKSLEIGGNKIMFLSPRILTLLPVLLYLPEISAANDNDWFFDSSAYIWLPESTNNVDTPYGTASTKLSAGDAIDAMNPSFMGLFSARKGPWSFTGDFIYIDLTLHDNVPFNSIFSGVDTKTTLASFTGYFLYNIYDSSFLTLDAGVGVRAISSKVDVTLRGKSVSDYSSGIHDKWLDPLLTFRFIGNINDKWKTILWTDVGGGNIGSSSKETWQISALLSHQVYKNLSLSLGYRKLYIEQSYRGTSYSMSMSGPVLGVSYMF